MFGDNDGLVFREDCRLCLDFGFIEQTDLIRGNLFATGGITSGQGEVELLLEGEYPCLELFVLLISRLLVRLQLLVASKLISDFSASTSSGN